MNMIPEENKGKSEWKMLNDLENLGYILVPMTKLEKLLKDSTYMEIIVEAYLERGETYDIKPVLAAIINTYNMKTAKTIREETAKLVFAREELEKAKAEKKEELMEILKRFTDGDDE